MVTGSPGLRAAIFFVPLPMTWKNTRTPPSSSAPERENGRAMSGSSPKLAGRTITNWPGFQLAQAEPASPGWLSASSKKSPWGPLLPNRVRDCTVTSWQAFANIFAFPYVVALRISRWAETFRRVVAFDYTTGRERTRAPTAAPPTTGARAAKPRARRTRRTRNGHKPYRVDMTNSSNVPEILAPAGDREAFLAALAAGADAVYVGLKHFSARMQADNFSMADLAALTALAHARGSRVYVAMNTLVKPSDVESAGRLLDRLTKTVRPDALIVQDLAMAELARQTGYEGELHLSTLANVSHPAALAGLPGPWASAAWSCRASSTWTRSRPWPPPLPRALDPGGLRARGAVLQRLGPLLVVELHGRQERPARALRAAVSTRIRAARQEGPLLLVQRPVPGRAGQGAHGRAAREIVEDRRPQKGRALRVLRHQRLPHAARPGQFARGAQGRPKPARTIPGPQGHALRLPAPAPLRAH